MNVHFDRFAKKKRVSEIMCGPFPSLADAESDDSLENLPTAQRNSLLTSHVDSSTCIETKRIKSNTKGKRLHNAITFYSHT